MAFEIGGTLRPLVVAWIVAWPSSSFADPPRSGDESEPQSRENAFAAPDYSRFKELSLRGLTLGKRGVEYRNALTLRRREVPFRVWGGRKRKQFAIGLDFEPRLHHRKLRIGAYGTQSGFGFAMRLRY